MSSRRPLVAGNWKLHKTVDESVALVGALGEALGTSSLACDVAVAPVFTALHASGRALEGSGIALAAQDVHWEDQGAFTGEVSAPLLRDVGCSLCIVGHSERRHVFGEADDEVQKKVEALFKHGLVPILCVGETLEEREGGQTLDVVLGQLDAAVAGLGEGAAATLVVAYEPVWAIGTGKTARPEDAQEVHAAIRRRLGERFGTGVADGIRILYGGSVKPGNAGDLLAQPDIDGALVGGASLEADSFAAIVRAAG
ncbi:MAG: triose-phosphate isomerase [Myxococcota bacterium]